MNSFVLGRFRYWIWVAVLMALKVALIVAIDFEPGFIPLMGHLDTALMVMLSFVVGARFVDIGWSRWLGIALVALPVFVVPLVLLLASPKLPAPGSGGPIDVLAESTTWLSSVALAALLLVTGCRRGADARVAAG